MSLLMLPYTNLHELNLDWIIDQLNKEGSVLAVNGKHGVVVLTGEDITRTPNSSETIQQTLTSQGNSIQAARTLLGITPLPTTAQTVTGAVDELVGDIADINEKLGTTPLPTEAQTVTGAIAEQEQDINRIGHGTVITASTLTELKASLLNAVNGVSIDDLLAIRIVPSFSSDGFIAGSTYGGYAYNIYKSSGTTIYFSAIVSNNIGNDMFIGYNSGTWYFNSLSSHSAKFYRNLSNETSFTIELGQMDTSHYRLAILFQYESGHPSMYFISLGSGASPTVTVQKIFGDESSNAPSSVTMSNGTMTIDFASTAYGGISLLWLD